MVPVPLGTEISILSSGRQLLGGLVGLGRAWLSSGQEPLEAVWGHSGCPWGRAGWAVLGSVFSSCSFPAGRGTSGGMERAGSSVQGWGSAAFNRVFKDKWAVTRLCPGCAQGGRAPPGCSRAGDCPREEAAQAGSWARRHSEPALGTMLLFSTALEVRAPPAAARGAGSARLGSAPAAPCFGAAEPSPGLHLRR